LHYGLLHCTTFGRTPSTEIVKILSPPPDIDPSQVSMFLDLDGTLLDIAPSPDAVVVPGDLGEMLARLDRRLQGRLAIVSGRSLAQLDGILGNGGAALNLSGSHGLEHRWNGVEARPVRSAELDRASDELRRAAGAHEGVLIEEKSFGVAAHYRQRPEARDEIDQTASEIAERHGLAIQYGKMVAELRMPGGDKGMTVRRLMQRVPMAGTLPVFVGPPSGRPRSYAVSAWRSASSTCPRPNTASKIPPRSAPG
jgi:trehalose 6-phosphate phosphatase